MTAIIKGIGKNTNKKQTKEKYKVKKCIKTDRPQRERVKIVRPTCSEYTAMTAKPYKEMDNPCEELKSGGIH